MLNFTTKHHVLHSGLLERVSVSCVTVTGLNPTGADFFPFHMLSTFFIFFFSVFYLTELSVFCLFVFFSRGGGGAVGGKLANFWVGVCFWDSQTLTPFSFNVMCYVRFFQF